jgi:hypothetical protein
MEPDFDSSHTDRMLAEPGDLQSVRQSLEALGPLMKPPMRDAELSRYLDELQTRPDMFESLLRVLALAA